MMPWAPMSKAEFMIPNSFHGTLMIGVVSEKLIACIILRADSMLGGMLKIKIYEAEAYPA